MSIVCYYPFTKVYNDDALLSIVAMVGVSGLDRSELERGVTLLLQ